MDDNLNSKRSDARFLIQEDRSPWELSLARWGDDFTHAASAIPGMIVFSNVIPIGAYVIFALFVIVQPPYESALSVLGNGLMVLTVGCTIAMVVTLFTSLLAVLVVTAFNLTMNHPLQYEHLVAMAGGLAGFLPVSVSWVPTMGTSLGSQDGLFWVLGVGFIAIFSGQTGALWFYRRHTTWGRSPGPGRRPDFRLQTRHLLALMFWVGLLMGLSQFMNLSFENRSPNQVLLPLACCFWLFLQGAAALSGWLLYPVARYFFPSGPRSLGAIEIR